MGLDILKFWSPQNILAMFLRLSKLAVGVLSVPASSAASERAFSAAGNVISKDVLNYRHPYLMLHSSCIQIGNRLMPDLTSVSSFSLQVASSIYLCWDFSAFFTCISQLFTPIFVLSELVYC